MRRVEDFEHFGNEVWVERNLKWLTGVALAVDADFGLAHLWRARGECHVLRGERHANTLGFFICQQCRATNRTRKLARIAGAAAVMIAWDDILKGRERALVDTCRKGRAAFACLADLKHNLVSIARDFHHCLGLVEQAVERTQCLGWDNRLLICVGALAGSARDCESAPIRCDQT